MDSTSVSTFVASFQFQEVDFFIMLVMTAFVGWRIGDMVRLHIKSVPKSKASKLSRKHKTSEDDETLVPQLKYPADSAQMRQKGSWRVPPTQTPAVRAAVPGAGGFEQLVSEITAQPGLQPPADLPLPKSPASQAAQAAPWRKVEASATPVASREDSVPRQLGRIVCWKETGYGFVVDEAGDRLFVRQAEVEGGETLRAGQLIWFHRGPAKAGQAAKALNVQIVSQEAARVMRQSAPTKSASSAKAANKALALPSAPKREVVEQPPSTIVPAAQKNSDVEKDDDSCASSGAGSKEEQIENLNNTLQWVSEKFGSQQDQQQQQL